VTARRVAAIAATLIAGGCAYLTSEKQGELIFRPTREAWWGFDGGRHRFDEQWIPVGKSGDRLHAWWLAGPRADSPAILYLHGARWNLTGSVTRIDRWRDLCFAVLAVDYRGFGESTDMAPTEKSSYEDAEAGGTGSRSSHRAARATSWATRWAAPSRSSSRAGGRRPPASSWKPLSRRCAT